MRATVDKAFTGDLDQMVKRRVIRIGAPFNRTFAETLKNAKPVPSNEAGYPVWVQGMGQATGQIAQDPSTSVDDAINILKDTMVNQVGEDEVETLK